MSYILLTIANHVYTNEVEDILQLYQEKMFHFSHFSYSYFHISKIFLIGIKIYLFTPVNSSFAKGPLGLLSRAHGVWGLGS